jgi:hypothetical protein
MPISRRTDLWARAERSRLAELRLGAVELRARALLDVGNVDAVVPDLDAHTSEHPWREEGWRLLAIALYRAGRQKDALEVVRRARSRLSEDLGLAPGPRLRETETDILRQAAHLDAAPVVGTAAGQVWSETIAVYSRPVTVDSRARLRSTVDLLRSLAVTGGSGLVAARHQRMASILAAEELGDAELTARVIGAYDVPAIWSRSDDPEQAAAVVAAAERALAALPADAPGPERTRLLATIALESRGMTGARGRLAAEQAVTGARRSGDPALLAFALNGLFMQTFHRAGLAAQRDAIGAELIAISTVHGLETYELLGRLIRMQALSGLGDLAGADVHALAADRLAERYGSPLVTVFTTWYRALRVAADADDLASAAATYRSAAHTLDGAGMAGLERGLLPLALLTVRIRLRLPAPADDDIDWGPYTPWVRPLTLIAQGHHGDATTALRSLPDPPRDHLQEALWCVIARTAVALDDRGTMARSLDALAPAAAELAGAGSGLMTLGPVAIYLDELTQALDR